MTIPLWPYALRPSQVSVNPVSISRSGGRTLGGTETSVLTDIGYWSVTFAGVVLASPAHRQIWNAIRSTLRGRAGLIEVPVWSQDSAPYIEGYEAPRLVPNDDGSSFDDGGLHDNGSGIEILMNQTAAIGDTIVQLRKVAAGDSLSGIRFSYQGALYETGIPLAVSGAVWQVPIFPAIRAEIPEDAELECERPTCIMRLATDREMDVVVSRMRVDRPTVTFLEAVDYWAELAEA